jgi:hypothetical protein
MIAGTATTDTTENPNPPHAPPLDWSDASFDDSPVDVGIHLDMEAPAVPLCRDDGESSSDDDDSIFVDLLRD